MHLDQYKTISVNGKKVIGIEKQMKKQSRLGIYLQRMGYVYTLIVAILFIGVAISGSSKKVYANDLPYTIEAIQPENQLDKNVSYFDLLVQPEEEEILKVKITNRGEKTIQIKTEATTAVTNENGVIDYSQTDPPISSDFKYPFKKLVGDIPIVVLKGNEQKILSIPLKIPKEPFDGCILGGLKFYQYKADSDMNAENISITNQYFNIIGVCLKENSVQPKPEIVLDDIFVGKSNYETVCFAVLQNITPTIIKPISIEYKIKDLSSSKEVLKASQSQLSMAPMSKFDYAIRLNGHTFKQGKYLLILSIKTQEKNWEFQKRFNISEEEIHAMDSPIEKKQKPSLYLWCVGGVVLIIVVSGVFLIVKRKKK